MERVEADDGPWDAVLARRDARPARSLRPGVQGRLRRPTTSASGASAARSRGVQAAVRAVDCVATHADHAVRDRSPLDHLQGPLQHPLATAASSAWCIRPTCAPRSRSNTSASTRWPSAISARSISRPMSTTEGLDRARLAATDRDGDALCSTTSSTSISTRSRRHADRTSETSAGRARRHGLPGRACTAYACPTPPRRAVRFADREHGGGELSTPSPRRWSSPPSAAATRAPSRARCGRRACCRLIVPRVSSPRRAKRPRSSIAPSTLDWNSPTRTGA